jgi:hypothetical protein
MDIFNLAERIKLLSPRTEEEASILALTLGAVYATALADKYGYTVRKSHGGKALGKEISSFVDAMIHNKVVPIDPSTPEENFWLSGLYFNDAVVRTDIAFEWTARYVVGIDPKCYGPKNLRDRARQRGFPQKSLDAWTTIGIEVNRLKHRNQFTQDRMDYLGFCEVLENLILAVEWCFASPARSRNSL